MLKAIEKRSAEGQKIEKAPYPPPGYWIEYGCLTKIFFIKHGG
tara:strand:+ start:414 stop:542 length:129 start_codon:yes stop_codon:yes gene_type:complete